MNLFLVTSPFQYICALEAKHHYATKNNILILAQQKSQQGKKVEKNIVDYDDWDHVILIDRISRTTEIPSTIKKVKKIIKDNKLEHFFHAEYTAWRTKLLLKNLPSSKEVYFDDGTLTVIQYEESIRNKVDFYRPRFFQDLLIKLQGYQAPDRMPQSKNFEIFTVFDIPNPEHVIRQNTLSVLKQKYQIQSLYDSNAPIGFIGQGGIGSKRKKTINSYIKEVMYFKEKHQSQVVYFPHRSESEEVKQRIMAIDGITYHQSELPLEIELIDKKIKLSGLVGILSTAQYTALLLYPNMPIYNLYNANPSKDYKLTDRNVFIQKIILELFARNGIKNITIPESSEDA